MTDMFTIGQFTVDENDTASNQPWWTLTTGQLCATSQHYCTGTVTTDQKEKRNSPRFAFLKISARNHLAHLQSRTSQPITQALQKSQIAINFQIMIILHRFYKHLKDMFMLKKIVLIPLLFLFLNSFTIIHNNTFYQYECISIGTNSTIKIWSPKKGTKYKFQDALKNAVELILFEGISGEKCTKQSPLLNTTESKEKFKKIEATFFSKKGDYSKFVNLVTNENEKRGVKKDVSIPVYTITVSVQEIEKYLKEKEILKPLNNGF